jgi:hypothetical protein
MGHRLFPIVEGAYLEPEEVAHRLRAEFPFVDADRNAGADVVERAIREFRKSNAPEELLDATRRQSLKAIRIIVADRTGFDEDYLEFTVMPGGPPYVPYLSGRHVTAAAPVLSKVCKVLGYRTEAC